MADFAPTLTAAPESDPLSSDPKNVPAPDYEALPPPPPPVNGPAPLTQEERAQQLNLARQTVKNLPSADEAAKLRDKAKVTGMPFGVALTAPESVFPDTWDQYSANTSVADVIIDPKKAVLVQDEVDRLVKATNAVKDPFPTTRLGLEIEAGSQGMAQNRLYFKKAMNGGILSPEDTAELKVIEERSKLLPQARSTAGQIGTGVVQQVPRFGRQAALGVAGGAVGAAVGLVAGPGGSAAMATAGATAAVAVDTITESIGDAYREYTTEWGMPHDLALPLSVVSGAVVGGLDAFSAGMLSKFPAFKVISKLPGIDRLRLKGAIAAAMKDSRFSRVVSTVAKDMATEGGTESVQEMWQMLVGYAGAATSPGQYKTPTAGEAAARTFIAGATGAAAGGVFGGAGTVLHEATVKVGVAAGTERTIEGLYEATDGLKSPDRAPEVVKEIGDKAGAQAGVQKVTVLAQAIEPLLAEAEKNPKLKEWLARPDVARQIETAKATGARITLSLGDFLAYVRPLDKSGKLKLDIGLNDEMSVREARELAPAIKKAKEEMKTLAAREAVNASPEAYIFADVEAKLRRIGATAEAARLQAEMVATAIGTLSRRVGQNPELVYRGAELTINSVTQTWQGTKSLDQKNVKTAPGDAWITYAHDRAPLELTVYPTELDGNPTHIAGVQGFDRSTPETKETISAYAKQGFSTALYLTALQDAKDAGVNFASDTARSPATGDMYARLKRLGIPFELRQDQGSKFDRFFLSASELKKIDLDAMWSKLENEMAATREAISGELSKISPEEIDALVAGLRELRQTQKDKVRGRITFDPKTRDWFAVTLTGSANLTTFLHESAHYLLEIMRKLALENPESDLVTDLRALEAWAGVKPGEDWSVAALEKFARGMETYFGEGKAPSKKLESAFETFKGWILGVYKTLLNLGVPLTDEVRGVMDRMFATQEEIDARRIELGYFPNKVVEDGMTPEQQRLYRDRMERGVAQARARSDKRAIAGFKREQTAQYKVISEQVDRELNKHPAIALRAWFDTGGERIDGGLPVGDLAGKKLNREQVQDLRVPITARISQYVAEKNALGTTIDPDELAPYFGFKNGKEMLESMSNTPARSVLKADMVRERMKQVYPDYGSPGWVEKTALESLHEENAISDAIEMELASLYRKVGQEPPKSAAAVARMAARQNVHEMTRKEMDRGLYRDAEARALRERDKALAAKDFQLAAEWTRKRLYAREMWQAVDAASKRMDSAEKYVTRFLDKEVLGRMGRSSIAEVEGTKLGHILRDAATAITQEIGLAETTKEIDALDTYLEKLEGVGLPVAVDPEIRDGGLAKWETLSFRQVLMVQDALKNLSHLAAEANVVRLEEEKLNLDAISESVKQELGKDLNRLGQEGEKESRLRKLRAQITKPETIARDLGETFHRIWMGTAEQGQFERDRRFRVHREGLRQLAAQHRPDDWAKQVKQKHKFVDGFTYTGEEVFCMLLNLGTESNRQKLILGMERAGRQGWTLDSVIKFVHEVFPDQKVYDFAQATLDYISQANLWEDSARVAETISGVRPEKVESVSIPTPGGGEIAGGYYPVVYDRRIPLRDLDTRKVKDGLDAMGDANLSNLYASHGFTESRTKYVAPLLLNPRALSAHIYEVDHFISNAPGILARHKMLNHPDIKNAIVHTLGFDYWDELRHSNNYIAADGKLLSRELLQASKMVDKLVYHNALLVMGGNVLSGVNQIVSGVPATLAYLGPKGVPAFARALVDFVKSPFATWQEVGELSGEIKGMDFHYDRDLRLIVAQELGGSGWETIQSRIANTTMAPVVFGQKIVNVITWKAAYQIALDAGQSQKDAALHANEAVRQSQSSSGPKDMTAVQRSKDGLMRVLTSLASYTFTLNDLVMPRQLTTKQLAGATSRIVMLLLTSMMAKALLDAMLPKLAEKDDKRRKGLEKMAAKSDIPGLEYAVESVSDLFYNVPVVGKVGQALISGREPRFASWVDGGIRALESAPDAFKDKGLNRQQLKAVVDTIGLATGTPTRHVLFGPAEFIHEFTNGNVDSSPWSFFQELALARPGQKGDRK